jgi:hypothetical protein
MRANAACQRQHGAGGDNAPHLKEIDHGPIHRLNNINRARVICDKSWRRDHASGREVSDSPNSQEFPQSGRNGVDKSFS